MPDVRIADFESDTSGRSTADRLPGFLAVPRAAVACCAWDA
jgi:hypothetical protein